MDIIIDKNLRELRKKRGNTQEELADFLLVSSQAVSKWERGDSIPDVAQLPRIAAYYNVTVDDLLGVGEIRKQERIEEFEQKSKELLNKGLTEENLANWREAYNEFPNDMRVIIGLCSAVFSNGEHTEKKLHEVISLSERILNESTDQRQRELAIEYACFAHKDLGEIEQAKKYANMGGSIGSSSRMLMQHVLEGDEGKLFSQRLLMDLLEYMNFTLNSISAKSDDETKAAINEVAVKLFDLFFDDGFYGFYAVRLFIRHSMLSSHYANKQDVEKLRHHLEEAKRCAEQFDELSGEYAYTSTILRGVTGNSADIATTSPDTKLQMFSNFLSKPKLDQYRDLDWFKAIEQRVREKAPR